MSYSQDLRTCVITFINNGGSKSEAARLFSVGRTTIYAWLKEPKIRPKVSRVGIGRKLDRQALLADVEAHPDALLRERAVRLGVSVNAIHHALKGLKIRRKKNFRLHRTG